jgi:diguanylate cyclase (GGDEF)-like protein
VTEEPGRRRTDGDGVPVAIEEARARIQHLAYHDALTGLANRLLLNDRLEVAIARSRRTGELVAVLFLDLDGFKRINDRMGHEGGDHLLKGVAGRLSLLLREGDTLARIGGDEFVAVISDIAQPEDVVRVAEKILASLRDPFSIDDREVFVTASIGVAVGPAAGEQGDVLVRHADAAMYRAKEQGRDRLELFTPALTRRAASRRTLETELRRALGEGGLSLVYQPILDIASERVAGIEALVRWNDPVLGEVPAAEFVPVAEEAGLITLLGRWVLKTACSQASVWRREGMRGVMLAFNVSAAELRDPAYVPEIAGLLAETGQAPEDLCLEISERTADGRLPGCLNALRELRRIGVRIALGDFGGPGSSLETVRRFDFDAVKTDPAVLRDVPGRPRDAAIARAVLRLGHQIGAVVVAEGVETAEQLEFLRYHRCHLAQGRFFQPALAPEDAGRLLAKA